MSALRIVKADLAGCLGAALVAVLFASSGIAADQKEKTPPPPVRSAPAPAAVRSNPAPAPIRNIPAPTPVRANPAPTPVRTNPTPTPIRNIPAPTPIRNTPAPTPVRTNPTPTPIRNTPVVNPPAGTSSTPPANIGRGTVPSNLGRGAIPNPSGAGATPGASGTSTTPNTFGRGTVPNNVGRGTIPNASSPGSTPSNVGRGTTPNASSPGNTFGRGATPNASSPGNTFGRGATPNPSGPGSAPNSFGRGANPGSAPNSFGRGANPGSAPNTFGRGNAPGPAGRGNIPDAARPRVFQGANGANAHFNPAGRPTVVQTRGGATIIHAPSGAQRIEVVRPGGRVFVTNPAGHGYVQRPIMVRGRPFVQRTYIGGGRAYPQFYRQSVYRGITFSVYTPTRFYSPRFYSWAYTPWRSPIYYNFGWGGAPWFGFYGGYFNPYPTYAGPNYWLTDYLLAASLQEAYQERMDASAAAQAGYDPSGQAVLSPQVKALVAAEVQRQLNQESAESQNPQALMSPSNGAPPILADSNPHVFVVGSSLIANAGGQECALTQGDVLQLNPAPSPDPNYANVQVLASKGRDCQTGNLIPVQLADLQEMQNHMRATLDRGLGELQTGQGKGGLPPIDPSLQAQTQAPYAADLPAAESDAADQLKQQAQQATQQQQDVLGQAGQAGASAPTIQLGQSIADVVTLLGNPSRIADLGQKKTYFYQDMKVIFVDGVVSDVQ